MSVGRNKEPQVLVLTAPVDPTADTVIQHLAASGVSFARFDAAQFPTEISLTAILHAAGGWRACLGGICLGGLRSIYYRRPRRFTFDPAIPTEQVNWCEGQARYGFWGVLETLAVTWVNPPSAIQQAEYKPRQLRLAQQAGLSVPPTMITSCPEDVSAFSSTVGGSIVTKALYARTPRDSDGNPTGVLYTAEVAYGVRQLMCSLGLAFGALDFAVDDAGSWWFYEINPNGQWLWIEQQTRLPISATLAELLGGRPCTA